MSAGRNGDIGARVQVIVVVIIFVMDRQGVVQLIPPIQGGGCGQGIERGTYSRFITVDCQHEPTAESEAAVIHVDDSSVSNRCGNRGPALPFQHSLRIA